MIFAVDMEAALEISYICLGRNLASVISKRDFGKTNRNGLRGYQRFGNLVHNNRINRNTESSYQWLDLLPLLVWQQNEIET